MNDEFDNSGAENPDQQPDAPDEGSPDRVPTDRRPLGFWLRTVDALITREFDVAFHGEGVTRRDWMLLSALAGDVDTSALAERLARRPKRLRGLERRGWAEETGDGTWVLTDEGRAAKERLGAFVDGIRSRVAGAVSPEDFATTVSTLESIAREFGWDETAPRGGFGRFRPGSDSESGSGAESGFGPGSWRGFGPGSWPEFGAGRGFGPESGAGRGFGPESGAGRGFGPAFGAGRGRGPGFHRGFGPGSPDSRRAWAEAWGPWAHAWRPWSEGYSDAAEQHGHPGHEHGDEGDPGYGYGHRGHWGYEHGHHGGPHHGHPHHGHHGHHGDAAEEHGRHGYGHGHHGCAGPAADSEHGADRRSEAPQQAYERGFDAGFARGAAERGV